MTAEIAIMNKEAIALAADSAVTINTASGKKIFNTVNKVFTLSKYAPVGIMVYGRADLMGLPWESIIKVFRAEIGDTTFKSLREYKDHFISHLRASDGLFPPDQQIQYLRDVVFSTFQRIRREAQRRINKIINTTGKAAHRDIRDAIDQAIEEYAEFVAKQHRLDRVRKDRAILLRNKHRALIEDVKNTVFEKLPVSRTSERKLSSLAAETCCKKIFYSDSGVVIAGFGNNEIFPRLYHMIIGGIADGLLRYDTPQEHEIKFDDPAVIIPFAQSDMVETFMEGIDPTYKRVIRSFLDAIFDQYPVEALTAISSLTEAQRVRLVTKLRAAGKSILNDLDKEIAKYQRDRHIMPVIQAVAVLSKDLLAEVAESLVNLTSFKRRISMDSAETVGGPIDVAVISRGDGFVWIKRKHYFKAELNPSFLANYFRSPDAIRT